MSLVFFAVAVEVEVVAGEVEVVVGEVEVVVAVVVVFIIRTEVFTSCANHRARDHAALLTHVRRVRPSSGRAVRSADV